MFRSVKGVFRGALNTVRFYNHPDLSEFSAPSGGGSRYWAGKEGGERNLLGHRKDGDRQRVPS